MRNVFPVSRTVSWRNSKNWDNGLESHYGWPRRENTAHCRIARDERFERLTCSHKGTYADDCLVSRVMQHRCYIVGTNDQALRRRIRKIPGVPIMFVGRGKYKVEKLPTELA